MRYLVICSNFEGEILGWQDRSGCLNDKVAVSEAFLFGTSIDGTDIVEIYGEYETGVQLVCQICF